MPAEGGDGSAAQARYQLLETDDDVPLSPGISRRYRSRHNDFRRRYLPAHLPISRSRLVLVVIVISVLALGYSFTAWPRRSGPSRKELDAGYFITGDIWEHNDAVSQRLDRCAALGLLRNTSLPYSAVNLHPEKTYEAAGCGLNATTIIIVSSLYFAEAFKGSTFGEAIWSQSVMTSLNRWGYSYMFSSLGWWNHDTAKTMEIFHKYPGQVRLVLADPEQVRLCFGDQRDTCLKSKANPGGLEGWRFIGFNFWDTNDPNYGPAYELPYHPLGPRFTLSPAPPGLTTHFSLPYSLEPECRGQSRRKVAHLSTPRAYLMTKKTSYLSSSAASFPWTIPVLGEIGSELGVDVMVGLAEDDDPIAGDLLRENGIMDLGKLSRQEYDDKVAESFVLIGAGKPFISPSPWNGLCLGVPFINPILDWDKDDPTNRTSWKMQHGHMADLQPPYVYSVRAHDYDGLRQAVRAALEHPIKSYIPKEMTFDAVSRRVAELVEWNWEAEGEKVKDILNQ